MSRTTPHQRLNELSEAYAAYRRAAASFQKVAQLLEVAGLFRIEILPEQSATEEGDTNLVVGEETAEEVTTSADVSREVAESAIRDAQTLLLTKEGYDTELATQANALIKDAVAHMMRGDIALILEEHDEATELFNSASKEARRAADLLSNATDTTEVNAQNSQEPVSVEPEPVVATGTITVSHTYVAPTHTYRGAVTLPTPCTALAAEVLVMESYPEQIVLVLTTAESADPCIAVVDERMFEVQAPASAEAVLTGVTLDGEHQPFQLVPVTAEPASE